MATFRYQCPASYNCGCREGAFISYATLRRHRDRAQQRLRATQFNPNIVLPLPPPTTCAGLSDESSERSLSTSSSQDSSSHIENSLGIAYNVLVENGDVVEQGSPPIFENGCLEEMEISRTAASTTETFQNIPSIAESVGDDFSCTSMDTNCDSTSIGSTGGALEFDSSHTDEMSTSEPSDQSSSDTIDAGDDDAVEFLNRYGWYCKFYLRHNATIEAMNDLLRRDFPGDIRTWKTVRAHAEIISGIRVAKHPYCARNHSLLSTDEDGFVESCKHPACRKSGVSIKELDYIYVWERLVAMLQDPEAADEIMNYVREGYTGQMEENSKYLEDFYSGDGFREYADHLQLFGGETTEEVVHIFFFLSTDGAPAFRSNTKSFWPVLLYIGNIPPDRRYQEENILPVMCIPGNPVDLEFFLNPLFDELEKLHYGRRCKLRNGKEIKVRAHLMHEMADLQAKRKLCLLKGVNGLSPCPFCEIHGTRSSPGSNLYYPDHISITKRQRNGRMNVVKRVLWRSDRLPLRTEETIRSAFEEIEELKSANAVGALANLQKETGIIEEPEIVRRFASIRPYLSMPIDLMHLLFENVAPQMVSIWLGETDTEGELAYLETPSNLKRVDTVLNNAGSGIDCSLRRPRGIAVRKLWKADEWRTFALTTSLISLHDVLPDPILDGWWLFTQICELSMRPFLSEEDLEELARLCTSFFNHYSQTYYKGLPTRIHLMKYVMHLVLHIPLSTQFCGPLLCLSQFSVERYIGSIKEATNAKHRYAESVSKKWIFSQSMLMLSRISGVQLNWKDKQREEVRLDKRSVGNNSGRYEGYYLRGLYQDLTIAETEERLSFPVRSRLERFFETDLQLSRHQASNLVSSIPKVTLWKRLLVQKPEEYAPRKYEKFVNDESRRSCSFFAAEFGSLQGGDDCVDVFYGRVKFFMEHGFVNPVTGREDRRILVLADWVSRGLHLGRQQQLWSRGKRCSESVFPTCTVEDVSCISRNVAVLEVDTRSNGRNATRTYFADAQLASDGLLVDEHSADNVNKRLRGISRAN